MDFTESDIVTYHDFFDREDFGSILEYLNRPMWRWGHGSRPISGFYTPFWQMNLDEDDFFTKYLFNIIEEKTNQKFDLDTCYCNGHMYGTSGLFHEDWNTEKGRTVLLYANRTWKQEWGGKTVFDLNGKYYYHEFIPNSVVVFPGLIQHRAETSNRTFSGLRKTVAWKLFLKD